MVNTIPAATKYRQKAIRILESAVYGRKAHIPIHTTKKNMEFNSMGRNQRDSFFGFSAWRLIARRTCSCNRYGGICCVLSDRMSNCSNCFSLSLIFPFLQSFHQSSARLIQPAFDRSNRDIQRLGNFLHWHFQRVIENDWGFQLFLQCVYCLADNKLFLFV